jgi:hypothetical protein
MQHLIIALSDELGGQKAQLTSLSNQLQVLIVNQQPDSTRVSLGSLLGSSATPMAPSPPRKVASPELPKIEMDVRQKAYSQDIQRQLKR